MGKLLSFLVLFILVSCNGGKLARKDALITTPSGQTVITHFAITPEEQEQGLSGVKESDFGINEGMLFYYTEGGMRQFWMPDTYFNLDLFYLDEKFKVLDVIRNLRHHPGRDTPSLIPRARAVWSWHVLEMRADSPISREIQIGDQLKVEFSDEVKKRLPL